MTDAQPAASLDPDALERLRALDPGGASRLVERVLGAYRASLQRLLPQMRDGRHAGDVAAVRHAAHTLKSSSASVGALRLSKMCAELEGALRQEPRLDGLGREIDELLAEGERLLGELPGDGSTDRTS